MKRGTRLILSPVGAYNVTQWMQFITYRPNVVLVGEDGQVDVIRDAEDLSDIVRRETLPERLRRSLWPAGCFRAIRINKRGLSQFGHHASRGRGENGTVPL